MYLKRVVLSGIKGFDELDLDLCPDGDNFAGWAVVTGDNGSGKTALLKAISLALLGPDQARGLVHDWRGWVTEGRSTGTISVEIRPDHDFDRTQKGGYPIQKTFWAEIEISTVPPAGGIRAADVYRNKRKGAANGPWVESTPGWFAVGYGPFRRLYGSSPDAQRLMVIPGRIPRFATLFKEDATLSESEEWVKRLRYRDVEGHLPEREILNLLLDLVRDDFLREGVTLDDVDSDGIWLHDSANRRIPLSDMSEGYRAALAMLIDVFRHVVSVYGSKDLLGHSDDNVFVDRPGVVMIDEADAHLHPQWQRGLGFWLKRHFPKVQFIVTTHSPIVCQAADAGRIYHLPQPGTGVAFQLSDDDYRRVIAGKPDQILVSPAFGLSHTRSPRAVEAREKRAALKAKQLAHKLTDAESVELDQLSFFVDDDMLV